MMRQFLIGYWLGYHLVDCLADYIRLIFGDNDADIIISPFKFSYIYSSVNIMAIILFIQPEGFSTKWNYFSSFVPCSQPQWWIYFINLQLLRFWFYFKLNGNCANEFLTLFSNTFSLPLLMKPNSTSNYLPAIVYPNWIRMISTLNASLQNRENALR